MSVLRRASPVLLVLAALVWAPACTGSGGAPTVTVQLKGDAQCTKPISVSGNATNDGVGTLTVTATIQCGTPPAGVQGVILVGRLALATGNIDHEFPPTVANGQTTTSIDVRGVAVLPSSVTIRVLDTDDQEVDTFSLQIN
jgi:hypothetical protein